MIRSSRLAAVIAGCLLLLSVVAAPVSAKPPSWSHHDAHVCGQPGVGQASCTAIARTFYKDGHAYHAGTPAALDEATAAALATYYTGVTIRTAYGISGQGDPSKVIAIVDANDDVNAFTNLTTFRTGSNLPPMPSCDLTTLTSLTSASVSPCFTKVNQTGGTTLPAADSGWANEIDLDLQAASAVCPKCSILLLEANDSSLVNLGTAVTTASNTAHVLAISNSYGTATDYPAIGAPAWDNAATKGIAVMASTGDAGYGASFPASATNVIAVGGTTLAVSASGARTTETAWSGAGSGCSAYNAAPTWQTVPNNPCAGKKALADVSADADPNSGLKIYTTYGGTTGWWVFGGTSLSSPLMASLYAMQGGYSSSLLAGKWAWAQTTPYFDVTSGSNGSCRKTVLCHAGVGWDGPTGRGSIATAVAPQVLTSIVVTPSSASVVADGTQQFTASAKDQSGQPMSPQPSVTWSAIGDGSVGSTGLFTAGSVAGSSTVTATSGSVSQDATVTVTPPQVLTSIVVTPSSASVVAGGTQQFTASAKDQSGQPMSPQPSITWTAIGDGSISSTGLFTAGSVAGSSTVTATSGLVSRDATVTVTAPPADFKLSMDPVSQSVNRGGTATYTVTITPLNGFTGSVTLSLTGQPSRATVTFTPKVTATSSTLTIKTVGNTARRTYNLTINGVSGGLSRTTTASLTVN